GSELSERAVSTSSRPYMPKVRATKPAVLKGKRRASRRWAEAMRRIVAEVRGSGREAVLEQQLHREESAERAHCAVPDHVERQRDERADAAGGHVPGEPREA